MKRISRIFDKFLGMVTAVPSSALPPEYSPDCYNVTFHDGVIRPRRGYGVLATGGGTPYALDYIQGYNASNTLVEEYVTVESSGGNTRPYSRHVTTGAATEIKNGVASVSLNASTWLAFAYRQNSYHINPADTYPVWRHEIGNAASFTPMGVVAKPTSDLTFTINQTYSAKTFTGMNANADTTNETGIFSIGTGSIASDGALLLDYGSSTLESSTTISLLNAGGAQDWQYNDIFQFTLTPLEAATLLPSQDRIAKNSIKIKFINNDGSPLTFEADRIDVAEQGDPNSGWTYTVRVAFTKTDRTQWDNILKIVLELRLIPHGATSLSGKLRIAPFTVGKVDLTNPVDTGRKFSYTYYNSTSTFESGLHGVTRGSKSEHLILSNDLLDGKNPVPELKGLGCSVTFGTAATVNADIKRIYTEVDGKLVRLVSEADTTTSYEEKRTYQECRAITDIYQGGGSSQAFDKITCGCPHKGWVVWGSKGGYQNIHHSWIGEPERFADDVYEPLDEEALNRGASFSLADNFGDEPLNIFSAGDAVIIVGTNGIYAQTGNRPSEMTPPKKLPGSIGCANSLSCCLWKDDDGNPGVAYLSKGGDQIWFAYVNQAFDGISGFRLELISKSLTSDPGRQAKGIAGLLYLGRLDPAYPTNARLNVDPATDSLWVRNGRYALVWWSPSPIDGQRHWGYHEYILNQSYQDTASFRYISTSNRRGHRAMDTTGRFLMFEYDWTATVPLDNPYDDALRDGGLSILAMSAGVPSLLLNQVYWKSGASIGPRRRAMAAKIVYAGELPTITVLGHASSSAKKLVSGKRWVKFGYLHASHQLQYKIAWVGGNGQLSDISSDSSVSYLEVEETLLQEARRYA